MPKEIFQRNACHKNISKITTKKYTPKEAQQRLASFKEYWHQLWVSCSKKYKMASFKPYQKLDCTKEGVLK